MCLVFCSWGNMHTSEVEILAHINFSTLLNFNNVTCFNFHDYDIFSIELDDKHIHMFSILVLGTC